MKNTYNSDKHITSTYQVLVQKFYGEETGPPFPSALEWNVSYYRSTIPYPKSLRPKVSGNSELTQF